MKRSHYRQKRKLSELALALGLQSGQGSKEVAHIARRLEVFIDALKVFKTRLVKDDDGSQDKALDDLAGNENE
jgi:hypothetical protein